MSSTSISVTSAPTPNPVDKHLISGNASIVEALEALNRLSGETMTLFVTDPSGRLQGSLTDGDVRRALLAGHSLSEPVSVICHSGSLRLQHGSADLSPVKLAREKDISLLPVVDADGHIVSLIDLRRQRGVVPAIGVLMAGGIGERLRPLTDKTPKPLLPVGGTPIIDRNVALLRSFGISDIYVTVNYLKEQIISHFEDKGKKVEERIHILEEPRRLGTIGSLSLLPQHPNTPTSQHPITPSSQHPITPSSQHPNILVMNADLLTDINLEAMYLKHIETEAWLTMAVVPYSVSVPFAIIDHEGDSVTGLTEKPTYNYYANAGIYLLHNEVLNEIPDNEYMDATDLVDILLRKQKRVSLFPIEGRWLDIGSPDDYRHAQEYTSL